MSEDERSRLGKVSRKVKPGRRETRSDREALTGVVERVTFHNPETGFCVLRVQVKGHRGLVAVVGVTPSVAPGEHIHASGGWESTVEHGMQFRAKHLATAAPTSIEGIKRYLGSGMIRGVGPEMARRLVASFGDEVFDVIENHPERLKTVDGIGPVRLQRILEGYAEQRAVREIMVFLQSNGVGTSRAVRIYKTYGNDAVPLVSTDPYRLARDIRGIGFETADRIARKLGIEETSDIRARAGLSYVLQRATSQGHCGLTRDELLENAQELLQIPDDILKRALDHEKVEGHLKEGQLGGQEALFLPPLFAAERVIDERLRVLARGEVPWGAIDSAKALEWLEGRLGFELADSQLAALELALESKVLIVTGGPGVGKTTLVNAILQILRAKRVRVALCAPTGRAAKRLKESTGLEAKTVHRLLEVDPKIGRFRRNEEEPLDVDLVVVDEVSMVDVSLMASLVRAIPNRGAMLLVGDVDQLPSVGPGQVLRDMIESRRLPTARLTEIFRQAASSKIVVNAHRVNGGLMPLAPEDERRDLEDFYFVEAHDAADAQRKLVQMVTQRIPRRFGLDPIRDVQVLSPMNRGGLGARQINALLQERLNAGGDGPSVERFGSVFRPGDKVMQIENDYDRDVFNGDIGSVASIDLDEQVVALEFDGRKVHYGFGELDQVVLSYASTIHKAQGSEYPAVVVPLAMQHYTMLQRNLLYTAITRGKRLVVIVGERRALEAAVRDSLSRPRNSRLRELLEQS